MLDAALRPLKDRLLAPLARAAGARLSPGAVTALGLVAGIAAAGFAWRGEYTAALACWLGNRVLDGLDGLIARQRGLATDRGGYCDLAADFLVYALIPLGLAAGSSRPGPWAAAAWLLAAFYVNAMTWLYVAAVLERRGQGGARGPGRTSIAMPEGLIGGTETVLFYAGLLLLPGRMTTLMLAMAALTALGALHRTIWVWRRL
jgi:phosphatidylglycerophosphate synthase